MDFSGSEEQSWKLSISPDLLQKQSQLVNRLKRVKAVAASRNASADSSKTASVVVESSMMDAVLVCEEHQQKMSSFCLKDSLMVCLKCLLYGSHKGHDSLDLDEEKSRYLYFLLSYLTQINVTFVLQQLM